MAEQEGEEPAGLPDRIRLPMSFDPSRLAADLANLVGAEWIAHFVPQHYEGEWSVLPLRAPRGAAHPILQIAANPGTAEWEPTQLLAESPYFREVLEAFECGLAGVRLMRLSPGSRIREHCDGGLDAKCGQARLHIPILTGPDVDFRLNGKRVVMDPGDTWYLRLADRHSVENKGAVERVHLVVDAFVNRWLERQLRDGADTTG